MKNIIVCNQINGLFQSHRADTNNICTLTYIVYTPFLIQNALPSGVGSYEW